jgi:LemA protein
MPTSTSPRRGAVSRGCLIALVAILLPVLLIGGCAASQYNGLVAKREAVKARWSDLDASFKRRSDLIPQLVATVKGAANFEQETLIAVQEARNKATSIQIDASDLDDTGKLEAYLEAQKEVGSALSRLIATVENYPELGATAAFRDLQVQIEGTENRIGVSRHDYIEAVQDYNTAVQRFPANLLAGMFGFEQMPHFEVEEADREVPVVDFSKDK